MASLLLSLKTPLATGNDHAGAKAKILDVLKGCPEAGAFGLCTWNVELIWLFFCCIPTETE